MIALILITLLKIGFVVLLSAVGAIHTNRYTYWNYIIQTCFYIFLSYAYLRKDVRLFSNLTIYFFPIVFGSVWFVLIYITIVLQLDQGWLFLSATTIAGGTLSVGTVHTFDLLIHAGPVVDLLIILAFDYYIDANQCIRSFAKSIEHYRHWKILLYYWVSPFLPILLYSCFFNPFVQYPTDGKPYISILCSGGLYIFIMTSIYFAMISKRVGIFVDKFKK